MMELLEFVIDTIKALVPWFLLVACPLYAVFLASYMVRDKLAGDKDAERQPPRWLWRSDIEYTTTRGLIAIVALAAAGAFGYFMVKDQTPEVTAAPVSIPVFPELRR